MALVVDESSWQWQGAAPDYAKIKAAGVDGIMVKATQGTWYVNPYLARALDGARAAGLLVGAYHFAEPYRNTAEAEAQFFLKALSGQALDLAVALDWEQLGNFAIYTAQQYVEAWAGAVEGKAPYTLLYCDHTIYAEMTGAPWGLLLWPALFMPDTTGQVFMQQTGQQAVDGYSGPVDVSQLVKTRGLNVGGGGVLPPVKGRADMPEIQVGAEGQAVEVLQRVLQHQGHDLAADGVFGPITEDALKAFQASRGLASDGICGPITWGVVISLI